MYEWLRESRGSRMEKEQRKMEGIRCVIFYSN